MHGDPPPDMVGGVLSLWKSLSVTAAFVGAMIGGLVMEHTGSRSATVGALIWCGLPGAIMWIAIQHTNTPRPERL
ncbi:MAG: hypothetical protein CSA55_04450 [Ilumatobacter coccineus]|uniref:Major facilitator superfamily (MFS) profile domain-containing protein n=1 Tax=Ilumatobacter coccineus TaxID=467094 RepID=A0A2G6K9F3_9ACTN|nr:MAG: hypothetical protein CSA55_04450 [Ilumatobacter coccineus]